MTSTGTPSAEISSGFEWCHPDSYMQRAKDTDLRPEDYEKLLTTWEQQRDRDPWARNSVGPGAGISQWEQSRPRRRYQSIGFKVDERYTCRDRGSRITDGPLCC